MKSKKGVWAIEEVGKWILIIAGLALVIFGLILLKDKIQAALEWLANFLRFGR